MLPQSLSKKISLTLLLLLLTGIGLLNFFKSETNTQSTALNQQKKSLIAPLTAETEVLSSRKSIYLTNSAPQSRNKTIKETEDIDVEYSVIPDELRELESIYAKQQLGKIELQVSDITPQELIDMETTAEENRALGLEPEIPFSQYPVIEVGEPAIPEDLEALEEEYKQLVSYGSDTDFNMEIESDILPYELLQMEAEPETSILFDIDEPIETDTPAIPNELKILEQATYKQHQE